jgi:hypothetical protein
LKGRMRVPSPAASTMARFSAVVIRRVSAMNGFCPLALKLYLTRQGELSYCVTAIFSPTVKFELTPS